MAAAAAPEGLNAMSALTSGQQNGEAREVIMQSIRAHLATSARLSSIQMHAPAFAGEPTIVSSDGDPSPVTSFRERLESVGGHCLIVQNEDEARHALAEIIVALKTKSGATRVALSDSSLVLQLTRNTAAAEATVCPPTKELFNYDVGVTSAQAGIAETGTLILEAESERHRLVSLLPPVHIAILKSKDI